MSNALIETLCSGLPVVTTTGATDIIKSGENSLFVDIGDEQGFRQAMETILANLYNMNNKKVVFLMTACKKSGPVQQMLNIIKNLDRNEFEPYLVTLYSEPLMDSQLEKYLPYVEHHFAPSGKLALVTGRDASLRKVLEEIKPDVIHSLGVFPDFAVSRMKRWKQIITLRNYVWEDYPAKFGKAEGSILARLHLYAMKHTAKTVTCSESLAKIYREKLGMTYDFIRNGVDIEEYVAPTETEKTAIRKELGLPEKAFIFVYTGQMIERKNVGFLLDVFSKHFRSDDVVMLMLGGGALLEGYQEEYSSMSNINFRGSVSNVNHYLKACDAYVSTSKSEGLPNGVLEAMAAGLPVVLSDIEQHLEIYDVDHQIGYVYHQGNANEFAQKLYTIMDKAADMGKVMKALMPKVKGMAPNDQISKMVKELLS